MKKIMSCSILMLFIMLINAVAFAGLNEKYLLLDAATGTGAEASKVVKQAYKSWGCDVEITGGPTAVTVRVEGNQGTTIFDPTGMAEFTMDAGQLAAGIGTFEIVEHTVKVIRGNLITLTGGTAPTVTLSCIGRD
ncbi:MAG: hypothetical protein ACYS1A_18175 [Planctomycetota bacterium]|jgi:hypothetical protein